MSDTRWEEEQVKAAARQAARIGGRAGDEGLDPAQRPLIEAGEGVAEGFELAEADLIDVIEHGDPRANPLAYAFPAEDAPATTSACGEADHAASSEVRGDW